MSEKEALPPLTPPSTTLPPLSRMVWLGLVGVVLTILGFGAFNALTIPPFRWPDEQAHAGYAMTLARGELPTIETRIPTPTGSEALAQRLARDRRRRGTVWVANHPPGSYVLALPVVAAVEHAGRGDLVNLALRLLNVLAAGMAAIFTFALGRRLVDERAGLLAAALFVSFPSAGFLLSLGMTDGISLVTTLACLVAAVRILGGSPSAGVGDQPASRPVDWRGFALLSAALLVAALTRLTALGVGLLVGAVTLAVVTVRERRLPWREALLVGLPAVVLSGWFWVGNIVRYGDIAASKYLLQRFGREGGRSVLGTLVAGGAWDGAARRLFSMLVAEPLAQATMPGAGEVAYRVIEAFIILAAIAVVVFVVRDRRGRAPRPDRPLDLWPWLALLATFVASWVMMAKHMSGGGTAHVRYVIVALPLIGVVVATAILRLQRPSGARRYVPTLLASLSLLGLFAARVQQTELFASWMPQHTDAPLASALSQPSGSPSARIAALVLGALGTALMASILGVLLTRPRPAVLAEPTDR